MDPRVTATINTMRESIVHQLSIDNLSRRVNISPSRLRQLFERETGRSPMRYLHDLRMQQAEHLLTSTFLSITEITVLVRARSVSHFVRDFKKKFTVTPS